MREHGHINDQNKLRAIFLTKLQPHSEKIQEKKDHNLKRNHNQITKINLFDDSLHGLAQRRLRLSNPPLPPPTSFHAVPIPQPMTHAPYFPNPFFGMPAQNNSATTISNREDEFKEKIVQ